VDEQPKRPRRDDGDFLERLSELDRNLSTAGDGADADAAVDAWAEFAERRRSSPVPPRTSQPSQPPQHSPVPPHGGRPLLDLFPPTEDQSPSAQPFQNLTDTDDEASSLSMRRLAVLVAAFLLLMAAGAAAAAYVFRDDLAAIFAAWQ
jgi:hypothetical protein